MSSPQSNGFKFSIDNLLTPKSNPSSLAHQFALVSAFLNKKPTIDDCVESKKDEMDDLMPKLSANKKPTSDSSCSKPLEVSRNSSVSSESSSHQPTNLPSFFNFESAAQLMFGNNPNESTANFASLSKNPFIPVSLFDGSTTQNALPSPWDLINAHALRLCATGFIQQSKSYRRRKARTVFSDVQLQGLENRFERQRYLSTPERIELATLLNLSETQIKTWFQNRRMKDKKTGPKTGDSNDSDDEEETK